MQERLAAGSGSPSAELPGRRPVTKQRSRGGSVVEDARVGAACWYNFARINSAVRMSPAMACALEQRLWDIGDIVKLIEQAENQAEAA